MVVNHFGLYLTFSKCNALYACNYTQVTLCTFIMLQKPGTLIRVSGVSHPLSFLTLLFLLASFSNIYDW